MTDFQFGQSPARVQHRGIENSRRGMRALAEQNWDKDGKGNIVLTPLVGYSTATLPEGNCMIRLEFLDSPEQPIEAPSAVQLVLTQSLANELAESIRRMAGTPHMGAPPTDSKH